LPERRYLPSLAIQGVVKWPTAAHEVIGTHEFDYSVGLLAEKDWAGFDLELSALYTFVGSPPGLRLQDGTEYGLSGEWRLRPALDLEGEVIRSTGGGVRGAASTLGGLRGLAAVIGPSENVTESTLGLAVHLNDFLQLEQGVVAGSDGSWQLVSAWEWDFSGR